MAVLLGVCDEAIDADIELKLGASANKIGGCSLNPEAPFCLLCGGMNVLVVQLSCPLDDSEYQRTLSIFTCPQKSCQNNSKSWRVLRRQIIDVNYKKIPESKLKGKVDVFQASDWCDDADDWGDDHVTNNDQSETSEFDQSQNLNDKNPLKMGMNTDNENTTENQTSVSNTGPEDILKSSQERNQEQISSFLPFYLSAFEEPHDDTDVDDHVMKLLRDYENKEGAVTSEIKGSGESYEKSSVPHGDNCFKKFMKTASRCPEQCLRYSWQGRPLPMSPISESVQKCPVCAENRVFEMQIMPAIISHLKPSDGSESYLDFGTVFIFSCPNSCWADSNGSCEEQCIVQADPDNELFVR